MKAVVYQRFGGPEVLEVMELPDPRVNVDGVLVRVKAAALNPADLGVQADESSFETYFPAVPGWDVAGVVERAGPGAAEFSPGDEVIGYVRGPVAHRNGAYAEKVSADVRTLARKPSGMSWAAAAGLPLGGLTALQALRALALSPGETLLVHGAAGGVGSLAVQLAVSRGIRVIGTAGSPGNLAYVRSLGASAVRYGPGVVSRVLDVVPGVDAVLDGAGLGAVASTSDLVRPGVRVASIAEFSFPGVIPVFARLASGDLATLAELASSGVLSVRVARTFPLASAAEAQLLLASGRAEGKVVLIP
ncbi:NADP-dependent oxidoreductase [Amycolatopsis rhabdoformis]|uniref:NADP-dependent oxidoreductase n=1 Tax=Amycolatopsis rhabdoformis TaxID=1448059 RepID=A0ABZ1HW38_9PSEU|nr:NADP-dependent oxidoreductase [Amycolatopsis rhabdoformis]WSE26459.1 NADP-dependent oxidoreductase [Amycolatopsis rhabdoformis]